MSASTKGRKATTTTVNKKGHGASIASRRSVIIDPMNKSKALSTRTTFSRTALSSKSGRHGMHGSEKGDKAITSHRPPVTVMNDSGMDVTPQPLLHVDPTIVRSKNPSNQLGESTAGTPTDLQSVASFYQTGTLNASTFGAGPFTSEHGTQPVWDKRSVFSQSTSERDTESVTEDFGEPVHTADLTSWGEIRHQREDVAVEISEDDLAQVIDIKLTETETIWMLDIPAICISSETDEAQAVNERNTKYKELVKSRAGNDMYTERGMMTYNDPPKLKMIQTNKIQHVDVGVTATNFDMFDSYQLAAQLEEQAKVAAAANGSKAEGIEEDTSASGETKIVRLTDVAVSSLKKDSSSNREESPLGNVSGTGQTESRATQSSTTGADSAVVARDLEAEQVIDKDAEILKSDDLKRSLFIMERVINLNTYQPKQASYRGFNIVVDVDAVPDEAEEQARSQMVNMGPNIDRLWPYTCSVVKGKNVSCMSWNKHNPDLFAVGYGQYEFTGQKPGLVCCWSIKNPEYPERIYAIHSGVTSMDFSTRNPNLLAVGMYDGTVAVYNVRNNNSEPIIDNMDLFTLDSASMREESTGKHTGPVWQLKWIEKMGGTEGDRTEVIISVSTDGRVTQWMIRKGFECSDLMKLKRIQTKQPGKKHEKRGDALISRLAGGLSFDFNLRDSNIYITGTEEGHIHKCSCSYNEQFLDTYSGHGGPVYGLQWSPFVPDVFLSCSADWSIRLWLQDRPKPVLTFFSSTKAVNAICWSPKSSTVFACVNEGAVEVWDLAVSTLDPIIVNAPVSGVKLTTILFARNSDSLLVGDSDGHMTVYQLRCMPIPAFDQAGSLMKIIQSSLASQLQSPVDEKEENTE